MEQQPDAFTQKRFELMIDMATKKMQQEVSSLKENIVALNSEIGSLKSQVSRIQFQPQQKPARVEQPRYEEPQVQEEHMMQDKKVEIVDCRPHEERTQEFKSGASKNSEPVRPRYGDYESKDVAIDKFFYFGRK